MLYLGNNGKHNRSSYTKSFPSVHTSYDITSNLKARATYSTSFVRPPPSSLTPNETPNDTTQVLTVNNQGLRPALATNWDAALEYYFELKEGPEAVRLYPGFNADLTNQPYFVVRRA